MHFNFRGVGKSAGVFDHGNGEQAAVDPIDHARLLPLQAAGLPLWLAGFSFGSFVSAISANRLRAEQLISIAPPVQRFDFDRHPLPTCPWLLVMGDADEVVEPQAVFDWAAELPGNARMIRMAGAGHFFHGRLVDLREQLDAALPT